MLTKLIMLRKTKFTRTQTLMIGFWGSMCFFFLGGGYFVERGAFQASIMFECITELQFEPSKTNLSASLCFLVVITFSFGVCVCFGSK